MKLKDMTPDQRVRAIRQACQELQAELNRDSEKISAVLKEMDEIDKILGELA